MTILTTMKSLLWPNPTEHLTTRAAPAVELFGPTGQRVADWSAIRGNDKVRDTWAKCATAYACLTLLADAVAESPLRVYQTVNGEPEERPDHRVRTLLANPNPIMSEAEFMVLTVMTMGLFGYAATEKVRSAGGVPVQLWPLRPDWLVRERTNDGAGRWVYRRPGADPYAVADDNIIIAPYYHDPSQISLGLSPLHIVAREIGIDVALTDLLKVFIDNGGIPPWVVKLSGDVAFDQADADLFRLKWRERYGGSRAYGEIGLLNPGMDLVKVGDSIGDMAWPDLRSLTELKIAQAFRVPADLIQARDSMSSGSLTTTEMDGAMRYLQNHGAQPIRARLDGAFTRGLLRDFTGGDGRFSLEFDTSAIMALQEDRDALHSRIRADWDAGLVTLNEARIATGRPDLGRDGEIFKTTFTAVFAPAGGLIDAPAPTPAPIRGATIRELPSGKAQRVYRDLKALSPGELETRASVLATTNRERGKLAQILDRKLRGYFRDQKERILASLRSAPSPVETRAADLLDWDEEEALLRELLMRFYSTTGERAFASVAATVGVEIAWDLSNPYIRQMLDLLGQRIVGINETTRQQVADTIIAGQDAGMNLHQIADAVADHIETTYKNRAMTIARTETQVSYNLSSQRAYQASGVVSTVEMVDGTDHTEDYGASDGLTCAERNGMVVNVGEMDRHVEAEHPNGSLAFIPLLDRPLGEV